jgi:hypothetical protein
LSSAEKKDPAGYPDFTQIFYMYDLSPYGSALKMIKSGTQKVLFGSVQNGYITLYTVPSGKLAFLYYLVFSARNFSSTVTEQAKVEYLIGGARSTYILLHYIPPNGSVAIGIAFTFMMMSAGDSIILRADADVGAYASIVVVEV